MPIDTLDELVAAFADQSSARYAQRRKLFQLAVNGKGGGFWHSLWTVAGLPGVGATPGASPGARPDRTTVGAIPLVNPAAGDELRLGRFGGSGSGTHTGFLVDRLFHMKGLSGTVTTAQNVDPTPTNPVNRGPGVGGEPGNVGDDVEIWIEWWTATGSTQRNITVNYINELGNASSVTRPFVVSPVAGQVLPIPLASGDKGCRSVTSVQLDGTTGTAGDFGVVLMRRIAAFALGTAWVDKDAIRLGFPKVYADACLHFILMLGGTSTGTVVAEVDLVRGLA